MAEAGNKKVFSLCSKNEIISLKAIDDVTIEAVKKEVDVKLNQMRCCCRAD